MNTVIRITKSLCTFLLFIVIFAVGLASGITGLSLICIGLSEHDMMLKIAGIALAVVSAVIWLILMGFDIVNRERTRLLLR